MVDLVGIEPTTSSMPWKRAPKLRHRPTCCKDATFLLSPLRRYSSNLPVPVWNPPLAVPPGFVSNPKPAPELKFLRDREHLWGVPVSKIIEDAGHWV